MDDCLAGHCEGECQYPSMCWITLQASIAKLEAELVEAVADGESVRAELRRVSDKCRQYVDQYLEVKTALESRGVRNPGR